MATEPSIRFCPIDSRVALQSRECAYLRAHARADTARIATRHLCGTRERERDSDTLSLFYIFKVPDCPVARGGGEGGTGPACDWSMWPANGGRRGCDLNKSGLRISRGGSAVFRLAQQFKSPVVSQARSRSSVWSLECTGRQPGLLADSHAG